MGITTGVVGLGGVAQRIHLPACAAVREIDLAGACDPDDDARAKAKKFGVRRTFRTFGEMLERIQPELVIVGTPPDSHFEVCRRALEAGAHVLCEKPFVTTLAQADELIDLAGGKNLLLRVNNQYRFMSFYRETRRRLLKGDFGRVFYIQCWQQMFHPPSRETNWRARLERYVIFEFGTHALDLISFFFDALPESLSAHTPRIRQEFATDVIAQMTLRYPEERLATCSFNRVTHAPERYFEMRLDCEEASLRISLGGVAGFGIEWVRNARRLVGKFGFVRGGQARAEVNGRSRVYCSAAKSEFATATAAHLEHFLTQMRMPRRPLEGAIHAREILGTVFGAYESAASGETVRFNRQRRPAPSDGR